MSYVRKYKQHIPFYVGNGDKNLWHYNKPITDKSCPFGIPVKKGQTLYFQIENKNPFGNPIFTGTSKNIFFSLNCANDAESDPINIPALGYVFDYTYRVVEGELVQLIKVSLEVPSATTCGIKYIKLTTSFNSDIHYSELLEVFESTRDMHLIEMSDNCNLGGVKYNDREILNVYLNPNIDVVFSKHEEEVEEEELPDFSKFRIYERVKQYYQFDLGIVPEHYAEFIAEITNISSSKIKFKSPSFEKYDILSSTSEFSIFDRENVTANFQIELSDDIKTNCCLEDVSCPQDEAVDVVSIATNQLDAEAEAKVGDKYIVPNGASSITNPQWNVRDNQIAEWSGTGWTYTTNTQRIIVKNKEDGLYYMGTENNGVWVNSLTHILSTTLTNPCEVTIVSVIAEGVFAKLQKSINGGGTYFDLTGYENSDFHLSGYVDTSTFTLGNNIYRLEALDVGCGSIDSINTNFNNTDSGCGISI